MFAGKKSAQIREILISESAWEEMTCLFAPSLMLLCCLVQSLAWAGELPKPVGKPILTIYGNIHNTNEDGKAVFDLASLEKLGLVSFQTTSPWYNGLTKFEGVPMSKLMDYVGAKGSVVNVIALNDYSTVIPFSDFRKYNAILALKGFVE